MKLLHFSKCRAEGSFVMLSIFALLLGGIIYIFFRPSDHVFFNWIRAVGLENWLNLARESAVLQGLLFPDWFVYSLPNGLWAFAYALLITLVWWGSRSWVRYLWMASIPVLVIGYEVLQYSGIITGTYCVQDLALGVSGLILGIYSGIKMFKSKNHEKACG